MRSDKAPQARPFGAFERMLALRYLSAKRAHGGAALSASLSLLAVVLAVFVLITVMSVMNGFRAEILRVIVGIEPHIVLGSREGFSDDQAKAYVNEARKLPGVASAAPLVDGQGILFRGDYVSGVYLRGLSASDFKSLKLVSDRITSGDPDFFADPDEDPVGIVLGSGLANSLGVTSGDIVTLIVPTGSVTVFGTLPRRKSYVVRAIFQSGDSRYDQVFAYVPLHEMQLLYNKENRVDYVEVRIEEPLKTEPVMAELRQRLGNQLLITDWKLRQGAYYDSLQVERNVMALILSLLVLIAALNIISGLVMLAKNKSRDIAILRTMGATRNSILRVFFMAGATIGIVGTSLGVLFGLLFSFNIAGVEDFLSAQLGIDLFGPQVYFLSSLPSRVEPGDVIFVSSISLILSFLAAIPPALRAASLDPVEALRFE